MSAGKRPRLHEGSEFVFGTLVQPNRFPRASRGRIVVESGVWCCHRETHLCLQLALPPPEGGVGGCSASDVMHARNGPAHTTGRCSTAGPSSVPAAMDES